MTNNLSQASITACEAAIISIKASNEQDINNVIWPSQNAIIERMLEQRICLTEVYEQIYKQLKNNPLLIEEFFKLCLNTAVNYEIPKIKAAKQGEKDLLAIEKTIAKQAQELQASLLKRQHLKESSGFFSDSSYHIIEVITEAAHSENNAYYRSNVEKQLEQMAAQYDLKHWPSLAAIVGVLADEAETTQIYAWDDSLAAATSGQRASKSGFLNALFTIIEESHHWPHFGMPRNFALTNQAWATLTNSLLNLCDDQMATEDSVKSSIRNFKKSK